LIRQNNIMRHRATSGFPLPGRFFLHNFGLPFTSKEKGITSKAGRNPDQRILFLQHGEATPY
jgi:hypothetical protein